MLEPLLLLADEAPRWSYTLLDGIGGAAAVYVLGMLTRWIRNREDRLVKKGADQEAAKHDKQSLAEFKATTTNQTLRLEGKIDEIKTTVSNEIKTISAEKDAEHKRIWESLHEAAVTGKQNSANIAEQSKQIESIKTALEKTTQHVDTLKNFCPLFEEQRKNNPHPLDDKGE